MYDISILVFKCSFFFARCIQELLRDKLVLLATHQVHFAVLANKLLVLKDVCHEGNYLVLMMFSFRVCMCAYLCFRVK